MDHRLRPESIAVAAGRPEPAADAPVNPPVVLASTYHHGGPRGYARAGTETSLAFETALGALEGGRTVSFGSGMAATAAVLAGLPAGAVLVIPDSFYNYHRTFFDNEVTLGRLGEVRVVPVTDTAAVRAALPGADLLWLELPTNPQLRVPDLPVLAAAAREAGARSVVDATLATPLGIRPLEHGVDVVMHSATKWIAGHSDLLMGVLSVADDQHYDRLMTQRNLTGAVPGALESYLALRGLRTLAVRLERCCANAAVLAQRLREHPAVARVDYLGFTDHPDAERIGSLLAHRGAVVSFALHSVQAADAVCRRVGLITHATSLGGVETLMERRGSYPGEQAQGTPAELIRLSVGIEHVEDLWADLSQALDG
ncbi:MAG TPA: PLP-dependent aspartate aminotransferase family protein [Jatrophihabitans sp.]|nr:PLP-dependent aspartate aminotransferase family protein [Jatrophihabitans sp.]